MICEHCISIIVPSFERREKILRLLTFIKKEITNGNIKGCLNKFEIRILEYYNLENELLDNKIESLIKEINNFKKIIIHERSDIKCVFKRIKLLIKSSKFSSILIGSDDDFPCISNALSLNEMRITNEHKSICGTLLNIRGYREDSLFIDSRERLVSNFNINFEDPLLRVINYFTLNSIGCSSISYSVIEKDLLKYIVNLCEVNAENLFYGGTEFITQLVTLLNSKLIFSSLPLVLRDFTYIDYKKDKKREAPDHDKWPYYGELAINICKDEIIKFYPNLDTETIFKLLKHLILQSKQVSDSFHKYRDCINPNKVFKKQNYESSKQTLINAYEAWKETELLCFGDNFKKLYADK